MEWLNYLGISWPERIGRIMYKFPGQEFLNLFKRYFFLSGRNLWQKNCILKLKSTEGRIKVTIMATGNKKKDVMRCQRCGGRMIFEKFYDVNNVFFGWHCVICGEILDPVILLHRLSQDADLQIPEEEEEVMHLVKKYLNSRLKGLKGGQKGKEINFPAALKGKISMN